MGEGVVVEETDTPGTGSVPELSRNGGVRVGEGMRNKIKERERDSGDAINNNNNNNNNRIQFDSNIQCTNFVGDI